MWLYFLLLLVLLPRPYVRVAGLVFVQEPGVRPATIGNWKRAIHSANRTQEIRIIGSARQIPGDRSVTTQVWFGHRARRTNWRQADQQNLQKRRIGKNLDLVASEL